MPAFLCILKYCEVSLTPLRMFVCALLTVLPGDVAAHGGVGHLVGGGEGEHVRAARHAPRRRARAVADSELVKVQPDLEDVKRRYVILRYCRYCRYVDTWQMLSDCRLTR